MKKIILWALCGVIMLPATRQAKAEAGGPIRPLANDHIVVAESPDPENIPLYSPSILRLDSGRLVACYTQAVVRKRPGEREEIFLTSDDGGKTWIRRKSVTKALQGRIFKAGKALYYICPGGKMQVMRSDDNGETWSDPILLDDTGVTWHQTPANVWYKDGHVYLVMDHRSSKDVEVSWPVSEMAPVLMRGKETDDLTRRENWTFASELAFRDIIPGFKQNEPEIDFSGIPFFPSGYPKGTPVGGRKICKPMGWLETNVVQIIDPDHYWYDPTGRTFHLFMRAHTGGTGYAAMAKVVENEDGTMTTMLETVPSGKKVLFLPFPGGQMRFHVLYDDQTKLYWMLGSQAIDSMRRVDRLPPERFDLPNNERHRMVLHFSRNMVDWCFAGLVAITDSPKESRHYASMAFDGEDLVILSRSGDARARTAHDGNLITFHRVKDFRKLVY